MPYFRDRAVPAFELKNRFPRIAILFVLAAGVLYGLTGERIFQLDGEDGNAVQAEGDIKGLFAARREMKLAREAEVVSGVSGFEFRVQLVGGLEVGDTEGAAVTFEAVAEGRERPVHIHPFAEIRKDLLAGFVAVQGFELGPFRRLGIPDEGQDGLGEDRALAVEGVGGDRLIAVLKKVGFYDGFESGFVRAVHSCGPRINRARSRRNISNGVMHLICKPMHASGILILRVEAEGISCVTTV